MIGHSMSVLVRATQVVKYEYLKWVWSRLLANVSTVYNATCLM
jgi:hypothetical protein